MRRADGIGRFARRACAAACALIAASAWAKAPERALRAAEDLARQGDLAGAVEAYRGLQVDHPDDARVLFGLGAAHYRHAESLGDGAAPDQRAALYLEAQSVFERLLGAGDLRLRADAAFNRGNCFARRAGLIPDAQRKEKAQALRQAAAAYEEVLREHPGHAGAAQNLDHVRYRLRTLLQQDEPPPQDQQPEGTPPPPQPQQVFRYFRQAHTEIPGARAVVGEDSEVVELRRPGVGGTTP